MEMLNTRYSPNTSSTICILLVTLRRKLSRPRKASTQSAVTPWLRDRDSIANLLCSPPHLPSSMLATRYLLLSLARSTRPSRQFASISPLPRISGYGARTMSATAARPDPFKPAARVAGQRQDVWYAHQLAKRTPCMHR
jgi:hypothetical protein